MKHNDIIAVFDNDRNLVNAIGKLKEENIPVRNAWTPFPVHDVLKLLGKESRLPYVSVIAGVSAVILVFAFLYYTAVIDYPLNYGGKSPFALPSFIVVIYLLTILITFTSTAAAFQARTGLYPGKKSEPLLPGASDDKFIIALGDDKEISQEKKTAAIRILQESGAIEIR